MSGSLSEWTTMMANATRMTWSGALLFGTLAISTAPATIVAVVKEARAKGALESALRDDDARVRMLAARALAEVGDVTSADSLAPLLEDADWRVRNNAALAIGRIGGENDRVIDLLVARLQTEQHELVVQTAAEAVGRAGRPGDVAALKALVRRRSGTIWKGAINGLADHHPDSAWEFVVAMAFDPRLGVSQTAIAALGRIGSDPVRHYLVTTYDDPEVDDTRKGFLLGALTEFGFEHVEFYIAKTRFYDRLRGKLKPRQEKGSCSVALQRVNGEMPTRKLRSAKRLATSLPCPGTIMMTRFPITRSVTLEPKTQRP